MRRIKIIVLKFINTVMDKNRKLNAVEKSRQESLLKELTRLNVEITTKQTQTGIL